MIATVPKERHREVIRQTKEEQMRKIAMLALQYERTIADLAQKQSVSCVYSIYMYMELPTPWNVHVQVPPEYSTFCLENI